MPSIADTILEAADKAYYNGEGRISDPLLKDGDGDGLALFIRREILSVTDGETDLSEALDAVARALTGAVQELLKIIKTLDAMQEERL